MMHVTAPAVTFDEQGVLSRCDLVKERVTSEMTLRPTGIAAHRPNMTNNAQFAERVRKVGPGSYSFRRSGQARPSELLRSAKTGLPTNGSIQHILTGHGLTP